MLSRKHRVSPRGVAMIKAKPRDWLAVSMTTNRKATRRQGRKYGEGLAR